MNWRARARKLILWSAASLTVLLAVVWIASLWWTITTSLNLQAWNMSAHATLWIQGGRADLTTSRRLPYNMPWAAFHCERFSKGTNWTFEWASAGGTTEVIIPLWAPLALISVIAAFAWRSELVARRRAKQHKCSSCGYDMAGLAATTLCPKCGHNLNAARPRVNRRLKFLRASAWMGTVLSILICAIWIASAWLYATWIFTPRAFVTIGNGHIFGAHVAIDRYTPEVRCGTHPQNWSWWFTRGNTPGSWTGFVPLWIPLLFVAGFTVFAWRRYRIEFRTARAACCHHCNYNRTGINPTAACPECGKTQQA